MQIKISDPEYWETLVEIEDWNQVYTEDYDSLSSFLADYDYIKHEEEYDDWEDNYSSIIYDRCKKKYSGRPETLKCLKNDYERNPTNMMKYW